jgi:hypothetical protein
MPCDSFNTHSHSQNEWGKINSDFFLQEPPINLENISKDNLLDKIELKKLKEQKQFLEASLCAVLTELEKREIFDEVINIASKNGKINLKEFWDNHKTKDIDRLKKELDKFSQHEIEIIKQILI